MWPVVLSGVGSPAWLLSPGGISMVRRAKGASTVPARSSRAPVAVAVSKRWLPREVRTTSASMVAAHTKRFASTESGSVRPVRNQRAGAALLRVRASSMSAPQSSRRPAGVNRWWFRAWRRVLPVV